MPTTQLMTMIESTPVQAINDSIAKKWQETIAQAALTQQLNEQNADGNTALHLAVQTNQPYVIQLLVQSKAKLNIKNAKQETPHDLAKKRQCSETVFFALNDVLTNSPHKSSWICRIILDKTFNSGEKLTKITELIVDLGHDINYGNRTCLPPLHCALRMKCSAEIVRFLLDHGADRSLKNFNDKNAYDCMSQYCSSSEIKTLVNNHEHRRSATNTPPHSFPETLAQTHKAIEEKKVQRTQHIQLLQEAEKKLTDTAAHIHDTEQKKLNITKEQDTLKKQMSERQDQITAINDQRLKIIDKLNEIECLLEEKIQLAEYLTNEDILVDLSREPTEPVPFSITPTAQFEAQLLILKTYYQSLKEQHDESNTALQKLDISINQLKNSMTQQQAIIQNIKMQIESADNALAALNISLEKIRNDVKNRYIALQAILANKKKELDSIINPPSPSNGTTMLTFSPTSSERHPFPSDPTETKRSKSTQSIFRGYRPPSMHK